MAIGLVQSGERAVVRDRLVLMYTSFDCGTPFQRLRQECMAALPKSPFNQGEHLNDLHRAISVCNRWWILLYAVIGWKIATQSSPSHLSTFWHLLDEALALSLHHFFFQISHFIFSCLGRRQSAPWTCPVRANKSGKATLSDGFRERDSLTEAVKRGWCE